MKLNFKTLILAAAAISVTGCGKPSATEPGAEESIRVGSAVLSIGDTDESSAGATRAAASDFSVNTARDKTATLAGRNTWDLFVQIYKGNSVYQWGSGHFTYSSDDTWTAPYDPMDISKNIYFPNYTRQKVSAWMTPAGWSGEIAQDQSSDTKILAQDALEQRGNGTVVVMPAKIPQIPLRHAYSMLDFIIDGIDMDELDWQNLDPVNITLNAITVEAAGVRYLPNKVNSPAHDAEYMVILPLGVREPKIHLVTKEGAHYVQQINIGTTAANMCYCASLQGLELLLSTVTVIDWAYGESISGDYTTVTSYPTFRGPALKQITITYFNGLSQSLTFNDKGESTVRPLGRRIIGLQLEGGSFIDLSQSPIVLNSMIIDLNEYI